MKSGDAFLVIDGEYQGMILSVRKVHYKVDEGSTLYFPNEDLFQNGEVVHFRENEIREWTGKDAEIQLKFKKLFVVISTNKTTLVARSAKNPKDNMVKRHLDIHTDYMKEVFEIYNRFMYKERLSKADIDKLNDVWKKQNECIDFYNNDWVYDGNIPTAYQQKYTMDEVRCIFSMQIDTSKAHAVLYGMGT